MLTLLPAGRGSALVVTVATAYCVDLRGFVFISKEGEKWTDLDAFCSFWSTTFGPF